jgi:Xaa-Pro aminopeptidase
LTTNLAAEKVQQAVGILREQDVDLWLTLVRETPLTHDPSQDLILGLNLTWLSALMIARDGAALALVGRFDADNVRATGAYGEVLTYDQDPRDALRAALARLNPRTIAINYSEDDPAADGLTHGLHRLLAHYLDGTPYADRLMSAEALIAALRGRKSPAEQARLRAAVAKSGAIVAEMTDWLRLGQSEREIADFVRSRIAARGTVPAWDPCPMINTGPESSAGHGAPTNLRTAPGHLLHMDFGLYEDGYCSDLQRMWYCLRPGETRPPAEAQRAFDTVRAAIEAARAVLRPGAQGWQVDEAARRTVVAAGYPEYLHGTGHHLGRSVHDGATMLGPRWERYGRTPMGRVEAGNVFTLELGVDVPGHGYLGLEEDVLVTENDAPYLGPPQTALICLSQ